MTDLEAKIAVLSEADIRRIVREEVIAALVTAFRAKGLHFDADALAKANHHLDTIERSAQGGDSFTILGGVR